MSRQHTHKINMVNRSEAQVDPETVEAMAYQLWLQRGCPIGSDQEDWYRAEGELKDKNHSKPTGRIVATRCRDREDLRGKTATGIRGHRVYRRGCTRARLEPHSRSWSCSWVATATCPEQPRTEPGQIDLFP